MPDYIVGDPVRLTQIVVNLIGNAIKFTSQGEVVIHVSKMDESHETNASNEIGLSFRVKDTGIGIPDEKQRLIFEAFTQADFSSTRKYGGTGLGLSISSQLVAMMGGRLEVESRPGEGSTFSFTAKLGVRNLKSPKDERVDLLDMRILVVDDNTTALKLLEDTLQSWKAKTVAVRDADSALALLQSATQAEGPFSLVLIDAALRDACGAILADRIAELFPDLRMVHMLSTAGDLADAGRRKGPGIQRTIVKPISAADLKTAVTIVYKANKGSGGIPLRTPPRAPVTPAAFDLKILLVEDNAVNRKVAVRLLEKRGHTLLTAHNGVEALQALEQLEWQVDLVLMDIQMPEMDGYQTTAAIRDLEKSRGGRLPIVAMTAHALDRDRERCLAVGMDAYLAKPINMDRLSEVLERVGTGRVSELTR